MLKTLFKTCGGLAHRLFVTSRSYTTQSIFDIKEVENTGFYTNYLNRLLTVFNTLNGGSLRSNN